MNKLMFMLHGMMPRFMAEAGGEGGGGDPPPANDPPKDLPADPKDPPADPKDPPADPKDPPKDPPADPKDPPKDPSDPVSALAQKVKDPPADPKDPPADPKDPPAEIKDEDFLKAFVADDETKKLYGRDDFQFSEEVAKKMLPAFRDAGINPEQASKIANAYAREQIASARDYAAKRTANIKEMNEAAFKLFPNEQDWKLIAAARDHFFKPAGKDGKGGTMLYTIARSELGSDPEFLALLKFAGEKIVADHTPANVGGAGAGHPKVSMAKALGIS